MAKKDRQTNKGNRNTNFKGKRKVNTKFEGKSIEREEDARDSVRARSENDPAWYGTSSQMVNDAARISFNNPAGLPNKVWDLAKYGISNTDAFYKRSIPGIMAFEYIYGPGHSINSASAVNLASKNLYAFVRHVNSGASNYEAADLMMYINGVLSGYVMYAWLVRAYGITLEYRQSNRYYNSAILTAMGFDPSNIEQHLPQFRFAINKFVKKLGTLPLPANLNIIKRQTWLPSQIIEDETSRKSQLYLFNPAGFYTYEETDVDPETGLAIPGYLKWHTRTDSTLTNNSTAGWNGLWGISEIEYATEYLCNKLRSSEDIGIMSGDIIKAYGQNVYQLSEISEEFHIEPFYSDEVLMQIHNLTIAGPMSEMDITQDVSITGSGAIRWAPVSDRYAGTGTQSADLNMYRAIWDNMRVLSMHHDNPSPDDVMVATRLMSIGTDGVTPRMGTELVVSSKIYNFGRDGLESSTLNYSIVSGAVASAIAAYSAFNWYPAIYSYSATGTYQEPVLTSAFIAAELDNYTYIESDTLDKMHEAAVLSLWDVPETAFYKAT